MNVHLNTIFQNIPSGIYAGYVEEENNNDCVIVMLNDSVCQMTGFSRREISEVHKDRFSNLISTDDRKKYQEAISELDEFPHSMVLNYKLVTKSGGFIQVTDHLKSVRQEDGSMGIYACIIQKQDVSASKSISGKRVEIETFGRFNVLVDGQPMIFRSEKAKELFALLIDRKGNYVSNREIITCLWEDDLVDTVTQSRCRKVVFNLRKSLEAYGLEDLVESKMKGYRRINTEMVSCDLYQYLSGEEQYDDLFQGSYLDEYTWAEATLSKLLFIR